MRLSWSHARDVLCVRLDALGDVLMTTPAIRALKNAPGRRITLLTSPSGAAVARMVPEVDRIIEYEAPWIKASPARTDPDPDLCLVRRLAVLEFDAAVVFTVYSQNPLPAALLCHLAGIPLRLAHCRENPYHLLTDWVPETEPERQVRHECRRQLDLVAAAGCRTHDERMSLRVPAEAVARARVLLRQIGADGGPWTLLHPGATALSRMYPAAGFAEVCRSLAGNGWKVLVTGSSAEAALAGEVAGDHGISLAGLLALEDLAALISLAPLLITNNTGPAHIAAAVGTPVVDLYALTNPQHQPWRVEHRVLFHDVPCKYCYKSVCPEGHNNCLRLVEPRAVVEAALELAARRSPAREVLG